MRSPRTPRVRAARHALLTQQTGEPLADAAPLFAADVGSLSLAQRRDVLDAWLLVLDGVYAHLPLKRALYGFDPVRALEHLRLEAGSMTDLQFHRALTNLINRLRDAHTQYTGPKRSADAVASLPFLIETFGPVDRPSYVVTKVSRPRVPDAHFEPGVTLEWWNGVPFDRAVDLHAEVETGGRPDARRARALESMTFRALGYAPPPDEQWVVVGYRDRASQAREIRFEWRIVDPGRAPTAGGSRSTRKRRAVNPAAEAVRRAKKLMFNAELWVAERHPTAVARTSRAARTGYEDFLTAREVATPRGPVGYLRVWSFDVDDDQGFLEAAITLLRTLPDRGLIIDLRDNPGGYIWAAERMLQLFTPHPITPTKFALRATSLTVAVATAAANRDELGPWAASLAEAAATGEPYSGHLPITSVEQCNNLGQHYGGPVVVVVDANTYSSGDLFTAGVVDNGIGPVVCIGTATGAGGANVWTSDDVRGAMAGAKQRLPPLPRGANFTLAVRRAVRSGKADGMLIEDGGVTGQPYSMTRTDVLGNNEDLLQHCAGLLAAQRSTRLDVQVRGRTLSVTTDGLDRLDIYCNGHPACATVPVKQDGTQVVTVGGRGRRVEVVGFVGPVVAQRRRVSVGNDR